MTRFSVDNDDAQIMECVCNGQFELFETLVVRYRDALLRVARSKLADQSRAEDLVQETFLAAFAARDTYNPEFAFRTWLWTILLNLCRRDHKKRTSRPDIAMGSDLQDGRSSKVPEPVSGESAIRAVLQAERQEQIAQYLDRLPQVQADALRLRFYGGLKFSEIAETMDCSLNGAKMRVRNGLISLAQMLRDADEDLL